MLVRKLTVEINGDFDSFSINELKDMILDYCVENKVDGYSITQLDMNGKEVR